MDTTDFMNVLNKMKLVSSEETCGNELKKDVADAPPNLVSFCKKDTKDPLVGFIVFYVNIGQMPLFSAEKYLQRTMSSYSKIIERLPDNYAAIWVPCRSRETSIEIVRF